MAEIKNESAYRPTYFDKDKAAELCYSAIFGPNGEKNRARIAANYKPFSNYLRLAKEALEQKKDIEADYKVVNRNNDYNLSTWISFRVLSKKLGNNPIEYDLNTYSTLERSGLKLEDIEVEKIVVDGENREIHKVGDSYIVEGTLNSSIVVNDNESISLDKDLYIPRSVIFEGKNIPVVNYKVSLESPKTFECEDSHLSYVKFKLTKDSNEQAEDEETIEIFDDPNLDMSIYDVFLSETAQRVYFDNEAETYNIQLKKKESGRIVIKYPVGFTKRIPLNGKIHLAADTNQISRQRAAIDTIVSRPSITQLPLLKLCDQYDFNNSGLEPFQPRKLNLDYLVLTDENRDGTLLQREFVQKAMQTPDFMILQGPPGSGKTTAILELIYQLIKKGKKVILCASTHVAIDNVLEKIITHKRKDELLNIINPVRIGQEGVVESDKVKPYIFDNIMANTPDEFKDLVIDSFNLICGTMIGIAKFPPIQAKLENARGTSIEALFDYMILDEASKTTFSEFLVPAVLSKRWIIVGDVKQLAPYVEKEGLVPSLLECEPLRKKDDRLAIRLLSILNNTDVAKRSASKNHVYILPTSSIRHIDARLVGRTDIIAVTNLKLDNLERISRQDINDNSPKLLALSSKQLTILVDSGLVNEVIPYLNSEAIVFHYENNISKPFYFDQYQVLNFRGNFDDPKYEDDFKRYSKKLEDEILWRMIRLNELKQDQGSSIKYLGYLKNIREQLTEEEKAAFDATTDLLGNIAIPSIITMLQEGVNKNPRFKTRLSSGLLPQEKENRFVILKYQHRMHPEISRVSRNYIYDNKALMDSSYWNSQFDYLTNNPRFEVRHIAAPVVDKHIINEFEANAVLEELSNFIDHAKKNPKKDGSIYEIAILSFYNQQVVLLRKKLQVMFNSPNSRNNFYIDNIHVVLNTVDKFQGQEADVVYLSMVQNKNSGFLDSYNRVNVAITRAKEKMIIFGDKTFFLNQDHSDLLKEIFKEVK